MRIFHFPDSPGKDNHHLPTSPSKINTSIAIRGAGVRQMSQTLFQEVHLWGRVYRFSGGDGKEQAGLCMCLGMLLSQSTGSAQ